MIWLLYILLDSYANYLWIEKKKSAPNYIILFLIRGIAAIVYGALIRDVQDNFISIFGWFAFVTCSFPFLFNTLLNSWRKKPIDYLGESSGWIDTFMVKHKLQRTWYWVSLILFYIAIKYFM